MDVEHWSTDNVTIVELIWRIITLSIDQWCLTKESKPYLSGEYYDFFTASKTENLTEEETVAYSQSYLKELENQSVLKFAERKSREEGRAEGREAESERIVRNMLKEGISVEMIVAITKLPESKILEIQKSL